MNIVRNIDVHINRYRNNVKNNKLKKPGRCLLCKAVCRLTWHGEYARKLITLHGTYDIPIKRLYCRRCNRTFALLPDFIRKFHRYACDIIFFVLLKFKNLHCDEIADLLMARYSLYISNLTLYRWKNELRI